MGIEKLAEEAAGAFAADKALRRCRFECWRPCPGVQRSWEVLKVAACSAISSRTRWPVVKPLKAKLRKRLLTRPIVRKRTVFGNASLIDRCRCTGWLQLKPGLCS